MPPDPSQRPWYLWDCDLSTADVAVLLADPDPQVRAAMLGKLMRQARPSEVFQFATEGEVRALWPLLVRYLGDRRPFWTWLLDVWAAHVR